MDVKSDILYRYPFPIAVTYLNADNAREAVGAHDTEPVLVGAKAVPGGVS